MKKIIFLFPAVILLFTFFCGCKQKGTETGKPSAPVTIIVGHVGHDHHTALFVALDNAEQFSKESGIKIKTVEEFKFYEMYDNDRKVADIQIVKVGGGSKMPTALAQNVIEVGLGGVAPVLASVDSGAPVKLISPLHYKGDMFVVKTDFQAKTWEEFIEIVKTSDKPIRIGYKSPQAVAKVIFEDSLRHEGIIFGGDPSVQDLQIQMINVQGGGKLNVALSGDIVDGYVGNNPFPAIAAEKNIGRIVCDLEELPPGTFKNHPCCCIAANSKISSEKSEAIIDLLVLLLQATETINQDIDKAIDAAVHWIGTSETVEILSIPTSGYSMETSEQWYQTMAQWTNVMNDLEIFKGGLKDLETENIASVAYDFSLLEKAKEKLEKRRKENE